MNAKREITGRTEAEEGLVDELQSTYADLLPKFGQSWNGHTLVALTRQTLSRALYYDQLYRKIVGVPGVICEFGVQWGATLALLTNLRGIYEPYNYRRSIVGFDTFAGFPSVDPVNDGAHLNEGDYRVEEGHEQVLERLLTLHEANAPISHIRKFELVKGDASETVHKWLDDNKHAIISMAIFDMDIYKPTKDVLEAIMPRLTKGSVLVFDELNVLPFPGETIAVQEVLGLNNLRLQHFPHQPNCAWAVFE
ncbi:crotonobetainyl-CoA--carnitine CoA-transferase [Sphingosinicella sp. BN140058]|uniref:Crotonobetainyl-CoA--carnitine CoA-transferase n=2 Tax=Alphaproteobacteria TaxID=28211 RepID=A0A2P7QWE0_9SPHN|nr:crotonobetainyl-CoA--carnitine CoA-transferase [Sphingomonas deserti]QAY79857.1 crotonobetainyl-CoA--carnitine CoA-transferase [Sphingosinicella sp. BN140058]